MVYIGKVLPVAFLPEHMAVKSEEGQMPTIPLKSGVPEKVGGKSPSDKVLLIGQEACGSSCFLCCSNSLAAAWAGRERVAPLASPPREWLHTLQHLSGSGAQGTSLGIGSPSL